MTGAGLPTGLERPRMGVTDRNPAGNLLVTAGDIRPDGVTGRYALLVIGDPGKLVLVFVGVDERAGSESDDS